LATTAPVRIQSIDKAMADIVSSGDPGCVLGAEQNGETRYVTGFGLANLDHEVPIGPQTVFQTGSVAKPVTAFAVLLLAERSLLSLDDPIRKYIGELPDYGAEVTIRHLLQHTSGIRDQLDLLMLAGAVADEPATHQEMLDLLARQKRLNFVPGDEHLYSNSNYTLLAEIVTRVAKRPFAQFVSTEIFQPFGMHSSRILDDRYQIVEGRATGYLPRFEGGWGAIPPSLETPGPSGFLTTAEDLLRFAANLHSPKPGTEALVRQMREPARLTSGETVQFGHGLYVARNKERPVLLHGGAERGFIAELFVLPEQGFAAVALCNRWKVDAAGLVRKLADHFVPASPPAATPSNAAASLQEAPPGRADPALLAALPGLYRDPTTGALRTVEVRSGELIWTRTNTTLWPRAEGGFMHRDQVVLVEPARRGRPVRLRISQSGGRESVYEKLEPFASDKGLQPFAGVFHSDELGVTYTTSVEGGELVVSTGRRKIARGKPLFKDAFQLDTAEALLEFRRDAKGRLNGLLASTGRARGIDFSRL
jgi:CubicO group peptidase (beta-lactamase class C family)